MKAPQKHPFTLGDNFNVNKLLISGKYEEIIIKEEGRKEQKREKLTNYVDEPFGNRRFLLASVLYLVAYTNPTKPAIKERLVAPYIFGDAESETGVRFTTSGQYQGQTYQNVSIMVLVMVLIGFDGH